MFKLVLEKAEEPEIKLPTSARSWKKQESSRQTYISPLLTMPKPLTVWITINCGKFWKRWEYHTTWPASWDICIQIRKWNEVTQSCLTLCDPMDGNLSGSVVHGIFQARILEWAAISFSRGSSQPRDRTWVFCIADSRFTVWATREAQIRKQQIKLELLGSKAMTNLDSILKSRENIWLTKAHLVKAVVFPVVM